MTTSELLERAWQRIEDPKRWTQAGFGVDADGNVCGSGNPLAVKWCALGAMYRENTERRRREGVRDTVNFSVLFQAAKELGFSGVIPANDAGHDAVRQVYQRAIALAHAEEGT